MIDVAAVETNVDRVRQRIADAGGDPSAVTLVAVTKGQPAPVVATALRAGLCDLGENYAQELVGKTEALAEGSEGDDGAPVRWHFIGRLQRNKVRQVAPFVALWQSVDRLSVAHEIARRAAGAAVLVQVNVTDEAQKGGCRPEFTPAVVDGCRDMGLEVRGLMAVGADDDAGASRAGFACLARLADDLGLPERSMGMSADLEVAVAEGSTMVRVGTDLFGPRPDAPSVRN
jgi:PLP dependent protein